MGDIFMIESACEEKWGVILIADSGEILYASRNDRYETNHFLNKISVFERIRTESFGMEMCGNYRVFIERMRISNQAIYVVEFMDTSQQDSFSHIAYKDLMSGLYNRNMWEHLIKNRCQESCYQFNTLIIIDIDNLKEVNDQEGHAVGDRVIRTVGQSIKKSIRSKDIAFRYGGDEFIILLNNLKNNNLDKLIKRIKRKIYKNSNEDKIHVSIGAASFKDLSELQLAFQKADRKLYEEKQSKKLQNLKEKKYEMVELKETIEETREKLNDLAAVKQNHLSEDILALSRKLDLMIYRYMAFEMEAYKAQCKIP